MSSSIDVRHLDRLPAEGCLIIPGRLDGSQAKALKEALGARTVTWLAEESVQLAVDLADVVSDSGCGGAAFDHREPDPEEIGKNLAQFTANRGVLVYLPGHTSARPGTPCHIPSDTLRFLCQMNLPTVPVSVSVPEESALSTETASLPAAILNFGFPLSAPTLPAYREALLGLAEEDFSSRSFLKESLAVHLLSGLKLHAGQTTVFDGADDSELGFDRLLGAAIAFSKEIQQLTKKPRVGIILPPGKAGLIANLAVLFANKIPVNLNFTASTQAVRSAIRQADVDKFITADPFVRKVPDFPWPPNRDLIYVERLLPQIQKKIVKWVLLSRLLPGSILIKLLKLNQRSGDDEAVLLFTSGSSGEPKGVPLSHRNVLANVCQFGRQLNLAEDARLLGCLPLFHSFGSTVTLWYPIIEGINLVTFPNPLETKRLSDLIETHKINLLLATPTFLRGYMRRVKPEQLASLEMVVTGAEKLPENLARSFEEKFGLLPLEGYGLTETSPGTNVNLPDFDPQDGTPVIPGGRFTSVGPPLPGLAMKITNPADDAHLPLNESGMIWFKGANVFTGYLDRPELTADVLQDGWFKTGDVGRVDDEGFLYIEGRISRFSKIAGEMVPHETVEAAINKILGLDEETERKIAIVGVPDEKKGEAIILLSTVSGEALEQELLDIRYKLLDEGLPALHCPKKIVRVDEIPVLASGKLDIKGCEQLV